MSWSEDGAAGPSRRALLAALPALGLAGCFRPMLAEDTDAAGLRGRIALPPIDGRMGYHLSRRLEERLGSPARPDLRLQVTLTTRDTGLAIEPDNSVTRRTLTATADWRLLKTGETEPLLARRMVVRSGYNATSSLYASRVAERTVERRLAEDLAERISREIFAEAGRLPGAGAS
ncbi:LPS assembly lipoprotein LptE [Paralimibaculum aggregatum]|uniref:LPS assembly lipoprotein LptE n=1 Tax=Paralimibaculum aggregatum TaxID=3036245 RepID=A0ABQ6LTH7_9RHOB|nr:LPS assembly lipoprotein LptE [Limibaculum sp. NKW23]GMG85372.1 LPS assembly lipoprotein LptE [Limibaculum sp. NKW23]